MMDIINKEMRIITGSYITYITNFGESKNDFLTIIMFIRLLNQVVSFQNIVF